MCTVSLNSTITGCCFRFYWICFLSNFSLLYWYYHILIGPFQFWVILCMNFVLLCQVMCIVIHCFPLSFKSELINDIFICCESREFWLKVHFVHHHELWNSYEWSWSQICNLFLHLISFALKLFEFLVVQSVADLISVSLWVVFADLIAYHICHEMLSHSLDALRKMQQNSKM